MDNEILNFWQNGEEAILFKIGNINLAFPMISIVELKESLEITKVIGLPADIMGIAKVRDELVTVIDIHHVLKQNPTNKKDSYLIFNSDNKKFSFSIDSNVQTGNIPPNSVMKTDFITNKNAACGCYDFGSGIYFLSHPKYFLNLLSK